MTDIQHAIRRGVPRSTARGWLSASGAEVVTLDTAEKDTLRLQHALLMLRRRVERLVALLRLFMVLLKVSGFSLAGARIPDEASKRALLRVIERSTSVLSLRVVLRVLQLSASRYHAWQRQSPCGPDDVASCPRSWPHQLTQEEVETIKRFVTSKEYRHVPTGTLALLAQRLGKVFASPATWYRLVRLHQRRRPRRRVHPSSLRVGIRASVPYEIWHVDTTLLRLLDGTRACLHAVIDNFSRRILAWNVSATFDPSTTAKLLLDASKSLVDQRPTLLADGRVENAKKLVAFYVDEHNSRLPHSAFRGQTPDEMYFGTGGHIPDQLAAARKRHANRA